MPFIPRTPESLIPRSDSKNPATTCKGITASGRPCRRTLATASPGRDKSYQDGVLAIVPTDDGSGLDAAAFFCWQHKDQAEQLTSDFTAQDADNLRRNTQSPTRILSLKGRSSIDTLVERIGVLELDDDKTKTTGADPSTKNSRANASQPLSRRPVPGHSNVSRRIARPPTWDRVSGPLMAVPEDILQTGPAPRARVPEHVKRQQRRQSNSYTRTPSGQHQPAQSVPGPKKDYERHNSSSLFSCCFGNADDDYVEIVRHRKRVEGATPRPEMTQHDSDRLPQDVPALANGEQRVSGNQRRGEPRPREGRRVSDQRPSTDSRVPLSPKPAQAVNTQSGNSETATYLSLIPPSLSPLTASSLLAELSKPISTSDEPGFIYIFCLKSDTEALSPETSGSSAAEALLSPPRSGQRRTSDVLREFSVKGRSTSTGTSPANSPRRGTAGTTILLKIGRASNVHRRMNEWTRQCGHTPSLVRFYPYVPSNSLTSPSTPALPTNGNPPRRPVPNHAHSSPTAGKVGDGVRQVPYSRRVERLIHLELAEKRVRRPCAACGKEHREWFQVDATRDGVKQVDDIVKRWVGWAEGQALRAQ